MDIFTEKELKTAKEVSSAALRDIAKIVRKEVETNFINEYYTNYEVMEYGTRRRNTH